MAMSGPVQLFLDPTQATNLNDLSPRSVPGAEVDFGGARYIYVKHNQGAGAVVTANGTAAYWKDRAAGEVSADKTENQLGAALGMGCAGIYQGVVTNGYYTWLQKRGVRAAVLILAGDGAGAVGNKIFPQITDADTGLRSEADSSIAASEIPAQLVGRQLAAAVAAACTVDLMII